MSFVDCGEQDLEHFYTPKNLGYDLCPGCFPSAGTGAWRGEVLNEGIQGAKQGRMRGYLNLDPPKKIDPRAFMKAEFNPERAKTPQLRKTEECT